MCWEAGRGESPNVTAAATTLLLTLLLLAASAAAEPTQDRSALLDFISRIPHSPRINWNSSSSPSSACDWIGVTCDAGRTTVEEIRLPGSGLVGPIPSNTLSRLSGLRVLSLRSNALSGGIPPDLSNLTLLRSLYLQNNRLSGNIPPSISKIPRLSRLDLSGNNLTGEIPFSLSNLTRLTRLFLERNSFSGEIPSISLPGLTDFNVSNNRLNGSVPAALSRFPASSFAGNLNLCGGPLPPCTPFFPSPAPAPVAPAAPAPPVNRKKKKKKIPTAAIAIIVAGGVILLLLLLLLICFIARRRRTRERRKPPPPLKRAEAPEVGMTSSSMSKEEAAGGGGDGGERNRLVFVGKGGGYSFDLEDLLRASAEVLGKGSVGTSYKAVLEEGTTVVVKRLKDVAVTRREFDHHMDSLGHIEHPNLLPLRAYYYSKDEKLLVFDFLPAGSLSALLHGSRGSGRTPLDWDSRMRVAAAAGRGLAHLHDAAKVVHGNIKASNVLLHHQEPESAALSDYGLGPIFGPAAAGSSRVAGYRAPEVAETRRPTFKSDVYSLGVLLLELLTGKAPNQATLAAGEEGIDLPRWVQSVVREEWTAEVFDVELMRYPNIEEEMVQLLQVAMACVAAVPDARPDARDVVRMMDDIVRRGGSPAAGAAEEEGRTGSSPSTTKGGSPGPNVGPTATP